MDHLIGNLIKIMNLKIMVKRKSLGRLKWLTMVACMKENGIKEQMSEKEEGYKYGLMDHDMMVFGNKVCKKAKAA